MMSGMASAAPDQLAPQQQDTAMSEFIDEGVDVRNSTTNSDINSSDLFVPGHINRGIQTRSFQLMHTLNLLCIGIGLGFAKI